MPPKRKAPSESLAPPAKKPAIASNGTASAPQFNHSRVAEEYGIVQREFYPPEMSHERCRMYNDGEIPRPLAVLEKTIKDTADARSKIGVGEAVVHWFKRDLRIHDNRPLRMASEKAKEKGVPLVCLFIVSPQDYQAHLTSAPRVDFELRTLEVMKHDLAELGIPLHVETQEKRKKIPGRIMELCEEWGAKHVYCAIEYEVDELRREDLLTKKCLEKGISYTALHDDVVVPPGALMSGAGKQYSVYSPWFRAWIAYLHSHPDLLQIFEPPTSSSSSAKERFKSMFDERLPSAPSNKSLTDGEKKRFRSLWPAGEHEAHARLEKFLSEKIGRYKDTRNFPSEQSTAMLSVHFSTGTLSARSAVARARDSNTTRKLDGGNAGITGWISELAWRDFYKHVLAHWPYVCMNKPFKYEYTDIEWEYNDEQFEAWKKGMTGFPIVDAAMRQMNHMGYMHNRCRMIVASFLAKDLLIDWRMGEIYFMNRLIDGDFASNNGGWGFSASTGVDPQPYFRIFNPLLQSEKFDEGGAYIRKWVPELVNVQGKTIHDPYGRGAAKEAEKNGYPRPIVSHKESRDRALERYKSGLKRDTA